MNAPLAASEAWFPGAPVSDDAKVILFCVPHAGGGGTSFTSWRRALPKWIGVRPVQLPGRENRIAEPASFDPAELARAVLDHVDRPYTLYGHSMGGVLAYQVTAELANTARPPMKLYLGGSHPPHVGSSWLSRWLSLSDDELIDEIAGLGGTPQPVLEHPRSRRRLIRTLRQDLTWLRANQTRYTGPVVSVPTVAIAGSRDPIAGSEIMTRWSELVGDRFTTYVVQGGHFFHLTALTELADLFEKDLSQSSRSNA
ncbi:thioesterase II family protein [Amycolatopsis japonica]